MANSEDTQTDGAEAIVGLYERHADAWALRRGRGLGMERHWIGRFAGLLPAGGSVLDIGCGSGQPIARHLVASGFRVVGIDSSPSLIARCRSDIPDAEWIRADMRGLALGRQFDGLVAWDSFFHLAHADQRAMFPVFRDHALPGAALIFTSGTGHGIAMGSFEGEPLYHASLAPTEYRRLLADNGFEILEYREQDPDCGEHTVWLTRFRGTGP
jgi:SAM-dependent methyltransferase